MGRKKAVKRNFYINRLLNPATQSATRELIQYFGENVCETASKSIAEPTVPPSPSSAQPELQPQPSSVTSSVATVAGLGAEFGTATGTISTLGGATKYMRPELATMLGLVKQVEPIMKKQPAQFTSMYQVATRSNLEGELVSANYHPKTRGTVDLYTVLPFRSRIASTLGRVRLCLGLYYRVRSTIWCSYRQWPVIRDNAQTPKAVTALRTIKTRNRC